MSCFYRRFAIRVPAAAGSGYEFCSFWEGMRKEQPDPKNKPGQQPDDEEKNRKERERQSDDHGDDDEEYPDLFEEKDPDFNDPDEQEFI